MLEEYERQSRGDRAEGTKPDSGPSSGAANFKRITAPVGVRNGRQLANHVNDQRSVMDLLDKLSTEFGGNRNKSTGALEVWWSLPIEGKCHIVLWTMIVRVQGFFYTWGGTMPPPGVLGFRPDG